MILATTVHTTGINWESVIAIVAAIVTVMSIVIGVIGKMIGNQITSAINKFRLDVVAQLDNRLTSVEQKLNDLTNRRR